MSPSRLLRVVARRIRSTFFRRQLDAELDRELAFHFEQLVAEYVADGLNEAAARNAARRALGNVPLLAQECRDTRGVTWLHDLKQDVVYGSRMLIKNPGFSCVVIASLALGIGANTAILGVMNAVLREPLPIPDAERVVVVRTFPHTNPTLDTHASLDDYFAWLDHTRSFEVLGAGIGNQSEFGEVGGGDVERVAGQAITPNVFRALGVKPLLGRVLTDADIEDGAPRRVVLLTHRLWQRRFGGDEAIVGREVTMNGVRTTIVGVMPAGFHYPGELIEYWVPSRPVRANVRSPERFFVVTGRLKPGVTVQQADAELNGIAAQLGRELPRRAGWGVTLKPVREVLYGWTRGPLLMLEAAVALVLFVACANVAGLLLARALVRQPEMAVRAALGAGRGRLVRQLLAESMLLALAGGALGVFVAWGGVRALLAMTPPPGSLAIRNVDVDGGMLAIAALISVATGLVFGLAPALVMSASPLAQSIKSGVRQIAARVQPRLREALVAAQVAITFVLLVGAGLMVRSFMEMMTRELHFNPERMLTFELQLPINSYMRPRGALGELPYFDIDPPPALTMKEVFDRLGAIAGVEAVGGASYSLINSLVIPQMTVAASDAAGSVTEATQPNSAYFLVTPGFFTAIDATLVRGRDIAATDTSGAGWVAVVNETAARLFWPGQDPIGKRLVLPTIPDERPREVVGVVRDIPLRLRMTEERPVVYTSYLQQPVRYPLPGANQFGRMTFMVRTSGDPLRAVPAVRRAVAAAAPGRPIANVNTMRAHIASAAPQSGDYAVVLAAFALTAALLAGIGIYGVMAYSVAQRTREIGIRIALGAGAGEVVRRVTRPAFTMAAAGLAVGVAGSIMMMPLLAAQLFRVTPMVRRHCWPPW